MAEHSSIITVIFEQFIVCSLFHDLSVIQDQDQVRVLDGGDAVCDDEDRTGVVDVVQLLLDIALSLHVDGGCRVVEY